MSSNYYLIDLIQVIEPEKPVFNGFYVPKNSYRFCLISVLAHAYGTDLILLL